MENFGMKEFKAVRIKAKFPIELGNRQIEVGETIAYFDKIYIAGLNEMIKYVTAHGGFDDRGLVVWETANEINLSFSQGVFSKDQLAIMTNSKIVESTGNNVEVCYRESLESDESSVITCKYEPVSNIFVYDEETGNKIEFTQSGNELTINEPFKNVIVDYVFNYNGGQVIKIGQTLLNGYVELEGRTRIKDDITGQTVTGIVKIPRLKLMSNLSIRLGSGASPITANFKGIGYPVGSRGNSHVTEFYWLGDDVDSDF